MGELKKKFVYLFIKRRISHISKIFIKKISKVTTGSNYELDPELIVQHKQKWSRIFKGEISLDWLKWYVKNSGISSPDFIPENIFYTTVEAILNNPRFAVSYSDKNIYDLIYPPGLFPENILRNIDGLYYDNQYAPLNINTDFDLFELMADNVQVFIKPALESGGGRAVDLYSLVGGRYVNSEGHVLTLSNLKKIYKENFIIQKPLTQHKFLAQFNATFINTLRVLTYRSPVTNKINILQVVFRVGANGQYIDNFRAGGFSVGVNNQGAINKFAFNRDGVRFENVNEIDLRENEFVIPFFEEISSAAKSIAEKNIHHRMLALDMTIDNDNKVHCIEVNNKSNEINFHQLNNGPLFGEFTDEVIEYCIQHKDRLYKEFIITTIPFVP